MDNKELFNNYKNSLNVNFMISLFLNVLFLFIIYFVSLSKKLGISNIISAFFYSFFLISIIPIIIFLLINIISTIIGLIFLKKNKKFVGFILYVKEIIYIILLYFAFTIPSNLGIAIMIIVNIYNIYVCSRAYKYMEYLDLINDNNIVNTNDEIEIVEDK